MLPLLLMLAAFLWAFAEATVFFLPADVVVVAAAALVPTRWLAFALEAVAGGVAGGTLVWALAQRDEERLKAFLTRLPGHSAPFFESVAYRFHEEGYPALFRGAFTGRPYKIFAFAAGVEIRDVFVFLLASVGARALRLVPAAYLVSFAATRLGLRRAPLVAGAAAAVALAFSAAALYASRRKGPDAEHL